MAKITRSVKVLCVQYEKENGGTHNVILFPLWNDWIGAYRVIKSFPTVEYGVFTNDELCLIGQQLIELGLRELADLDLSDDEVVEDAIDDWFDFGFVNEMVTLVKWGTKKVKIEMELNLA